MRHGLPILLLLLVLGQASGVVWWVSQDVCIDTCADDAGGEESCPPVCPTCACARPAPSIAIELPQIATLAVPPPVAAGCFVEGDSPAPSPEPHEILHVPIRLPG